MKYYSVTAVTCHRGQTFDAEVQLKIEEGFENEPTYRQVCVETGFFKQESAKAAAERVADSVRAAMLDGANSVLNKYPKAKE